MNVLKSVLENKKIIKEYKSYIEDKNFNSAILLINDADFQLQDKMFEIAILKGSFNIVKYCADNLSKEPEDVLNIINKNKNSSKEIQEILRWAEFGVKVKEFNKKLKGNLSKSDAVEKIKELFNDKNYEDVINSYKNYNYLNYPMIFAVTKGNIELAKFLIEKKADPGLTSYGDLLTLSCKNNDLEMVKCLVDAGANVNVLNGSALREAINNSNLEIVTYLIDNGADFLMNNSASLTLISKPSDFEIGYLLLDRGANPERATPEMLNYFKIKKLHDTLDNNLDININVVKRNKI